MRSRPRSSKPPDPATSTATIVWYVGLYAAAVPKPRTADGTIASGASGRNSRDPLPGTGPTPYDRDISACDGHTRWPAADWAECKTLTGPGRRHGLGRIRGTGVMEPPNGDRAAPTMLRKSLKIRTIAGPEAAVRSIVEPFRDGTARRPALREDPKIRSRNGLRTTLGGHGAGCQMSDGVGHNRRPSVIIG
jgi:hypothetical protein